MEEVAGLQIFDKNGKIILDLTDRINRVIGVLDIKNTDEGSLMVEQFANGTPWYYLVRMTGTSQINREYYNPIVNITGNIISWEPSSSAAYGERNTFRLVYGVF